VIPAKIVDASAVAAILFEEPERDDVVGRLAGLELHAPFLLAHEIASVCTKKARQNAQNEIRYLRAAEYLDRLNIQFHEIDVRAVAELALRHKLSANDASYLWLARELVLDLVTLDRNLEEVASGH
jgi:predicted nucleic acid-binding protein